MVKEGHAVGLLSGDLSIEQRAAIINRFKDAKEKVLITTNVTARGECPSLCLLLEVFCQSLFCFTYLCKVGKMGRKR